MPRSFDVKLRSFMLSGAARLLMSVVSLAALFLLIGTYDLRMLSEILIYLTLAQLWNLLAGYAGLVSVGQQAFVGIGGYTFFYFATAAGFNPFVAILAAACAGTIAAGIASIFIFRLSGAYFAIGTWVMAEICLLTVAITPQLGGGSGISLPTSVALSVGATRPERELVYATIAFVLALTAIVSIALLLRSRYGLALVAVRDSERAALSLGVNSTRIKRTVFVGVGAVTAAVGALIFLMKLRMTPDSAFSLLDWTAYVLFIVVIGGNGRIAGPFVGTLTFFLLRTLFAGFGPIYLVVLGTAAVLVMLFAPGGICGIAGDRFAPGRFSRARRQPRAPRSTGTLKREGMT